MLSILIPTKDYNCCKLAEALQQQATAIGLPYEIIVGEDGSSPQGLQMNTSIMQLPGCRIVRLSHNVGRSKMRNILAEEAKGENIMFIDSDAIVENDTFLIKYIKALETYSVVCGGLYHADKLNDKRCTLRYRYEKNADTRRSAAHRSKAPYDNFTTFCFAIRRDIFIQIKFNEEINRYGYEDTLFGHELRKRDIAIKHIDSPLLHNGLEENAVYLNKIEESLHTLHNIRKEIGSTPLLRCCNRLKSLYLTGTVAYLWRILKAPLRRNLLSNTPSLILLNIYKVGYFCNIETRQKGERAKQH